MPETFVHSLSTLETITTDEGKKVVMNSWAFASVVWSALLEGNSKAMSITQELFADKSRIPLLILQSKQGDETATREAIAIIAFALDDKIQEAFESSK